MAKSFLNKRQKLEQKGYRNDPSSMKLKSALAQSLDREKCEGPQYLKEFIRKQDLFVLGHKFCEDHLDMAGVSDHLNPIQLLEFTSCMLSMVLSHKYQKDWLVEMIKETPIDFNEVRETMYKYSKKAEENFFSNCCLSYFFVSFANSEKSIEYITKKFKNHGTKDRAIEALQIMGKEAEKVMFQEFAKDVDIWLNIHKEFVCDSQTNFNQIVEKIQGSMTSFVLLLNLNHAKDCLYIIHTMLQSQHKKWKT